ncbi:MAG: glycine--tRNA ligase subunit alpha, partial [Alphaproteobacteria bacterium]|nr:glycine--tRNA ligase subunit alpha [Alphaproteobacteria bacterium]
YVQGVENVYDLDFNGAGLKYGDVFQEAERQYSEFNFEHADVDMLIEWFKGAESQCMALLNLDKPLPLPAYDFCLKASHLFNLVDARGAISVAERASWIARVRELAKGCAEAWVKSERAALEVAE